MKSLLPLIVAAPLLALAACNSQPSQPEVVDTNPDPMANILANRAPVELPPAIKSDKTFRCKDQSLAFVTFFQGRSEEHTSELQSRPHLVCRLLLEKKKKQK